MSEQFLNSMLDNAPACRLGWLQLSLAHLERKREEIPSCLVHLCSFFPKLSCDVKMENAYSCDSLSVVPVSIFLGWWPAAARGGAEAHQSVPKDSESVTQQ